MTSIGSTASTKALQTTPTDALAKTYARDGVIFLPGALHAAQIALVEAAFDYSMAHPGPVAFPAPPEDGPFFYSDNGASASWRTEPYLRLFRETPIGAICQALFGSKAVWFINEQLFWKQGGAISRTPWHQDTSYFKFDGPDQAVVWVALDDLPQGSAIEVVRGSHNGPLYDGFGTVTGKGEVTGDSAVCDGALPPLPDIEAERAAWDIVTWSINRGDLIIFHPRALHGGAATFVGMRRRTLSLRLCGPSTVRVDRADFPDPATDLNRHNLHVEIRALPLGTPIHHAPSTLRVWPSVEP